MPGPSRGGLKGPREDLARPQVMQMTSAVVAVPGSKAGESWESGGAIAYLSIHHGQRFNSNGTRRVAVQSHVSRLHVIAVVEWKWLRIEDWSC